MNQGRLLRGGSVLKDGSGTGKKGDVGKSVPGRQSLGCLRKEFYFPEHQRINGERH